MKVDKVLKNISKNVRLLREKNGLTQLQISHYLKMERKGYQKIEYGETSDMRLSTMLKILEYYNITFEELIK